MKTLRFALAAAVLSVTLAACRGGSPTAPARPPAHRSADAAGDSSHTPPPTTAATPPPALPTDPPPPDPRQIYGSGT